MYTKAELLAALDHVNEEKLQRLGPLPDYEEFEAYFADTIDAEAATRIAGFLDCDPHLRAMMLAPFPEDGEPITDEELATRWDQLVRAIAGTGDAGEATHGASS